MKRRKFLQAGGAAIATAAFVRGAASQSSATTLKFVPQVDLSSLDPIVNTAQITSNYAFAVYDTLYAVNAKLEPRPQMAEGHTVSADGRTYLIRLREGLKFHDGEPVRAQDCAPSLARWAARDTMGQTLSTFVESWGVQDDRTLKVSLKQPFPMLFDALAKPGTSVPFIMPERVAKTPPTQEVKESIGSGPFRFAKDEFVPGSRAVFTKFDGYISRPEPPDWASGAKNVHFQRVEWHVIPDPGTAAAALQNGEVDWWQVASGDLLPLLQRNKDIALNIADLSGANPILRFNHLNAPFNNALNRRAVLVSLNQEDYLRVVTGNDPSSYRLCKSMFPCGTTFGTPVGDPIMKGDLNAGKQLLKESGYAGEKVVILSPSDNPLAAPFGEVTADLLRKLGMNVELVTTDFGTMLQRRNNRGPVEQGGWSIFHAPVTGTSVFNPLIAMPVRGQGASGYAGWYSSEKIEGLVKDWLVAKDASERLAVSDAIQREAFATVPSVPLGQFVSHGAYRKSLKGIIDGPAPFFWSVQRA